MSIPDNTLQTVWSMLLRHMLYCTLCHVDGFAEPSASVLYMQHLFS